MKLNQMIDHTILKPEATRADVKKLVDEAVDYDFFSVCVNSSFVKYVHDYKPDLTIAAVVGFPLGAMATPAKAYETKCAIEDGAKEIDMVIEIGRLKEGDYDYVRDDIKAVKEACWENILKVIIETCLLSE